MNGIQGQDSKQTSRWEEQVINPFINSLSLHLSPRAVCKPLNPCRNTTQRLAQSVLGPVRVCRGCTPPPCLLSLCSPSLQAVIKYAPSRPISQNQCLISGGAWDPHICKSTSALLQRGEEEGLQPCPKYTPMHKHIHTHLKQFLSQYTIQPDSYTHTTSN